jgi:hypothetical protein
MPGNNKQYASLSLLILLTLILAMILLIQPAFAVDIPTGVDGRILTPDKTGDYSDWIELARYNGHSLIIRKDVLPNSRMEFDKRNINAYIISDARNVVNNWFKNTLNSNAKLRDHTVLSNPLYYVGNFGVINNGFCLPSGGAARTGDDVAFLLSFGEAAMFCSEQYAITTTSWNYSPQVAKQNFNKLSWEPTEASGTRRAFWWLRSEGHNSGTVKNACSVGSHSQALLNCVYASSSQAGYPYIRPALWVGSGIFEDNYILSYDANGGTGAPGPQTVVPNTNAVISINMPTHASLDFAGWATSPGATVA